MVKVSKQNKVDDANVVYVRTDMFLVLWWSKESPNFHLLEVPCHEQLSSNWSETSAKWHGKHEIWESGSFIQSLCVGLCAYMHVCNMHDCVCACMSMHVYACVFMYVYGV